MKYNKTFLMLLLLILLLTISCSGENKKTITVFAAASTSDIVNEIALLYQKEKGVTLKVNTASSGILAKQITNGAEADIYISASKSWIEYLDDILIEKKVLFQNSLVLITPGTSDNNEINTNDRLSIGDPAHVPAGVYAIEALKNSNLFNKVENIILPAANVRAALSVVEMGEVESGIVYKTDALKSQKVRIIYEFPLESHSDIEYHCALINDNDFNREFYTFLTEGIEAKKIYLNNGFKIKE